MAPRLRAKPATQARMQRSATQFSELEVTPSRHEDQPRGVVATTEDNHAEAIKGTEQGVRSANPFSWSDAGSTSNTRRSSPANNSEVPADDAWQFDDLESLDPFSSPLLADSYLPDTIPIHESEAKGPDTLKQHIDFSETASTMRRSSPVATSDAIKDIWDFQDSPHAVTSSPDTTKGISESLPAQISIDDLYGRTPRKQSPPEPAVVNQSVHESKRSTQPGQRAKKRQRAKEPIRFDPRTHEIIDVPATKKRTTAPRLPIVRALQESAAASTSPKEGSTKKKPRKPATSRQTKKANPEARPVQAGRPSQKTGLVAQNRSPAAVVIRSSSASIDPPCAERHGAVSTSSHASMNLPASTGLTASTHLHAGAHIPASMNRPAVTNLPAVTDLPANMDLPASAHLPASTHLSAVADLPASMNVPAHTHLPARIHLPARAIDVPAAVPDPKEHHRPSPVAINESDSEPEPELIEQHKAKRRRLSRQFSVSERGSPVVVNDPPGRRIEHVPSRPKPAVTSIPEQHPAVQHPSFLRSKSTDKQIEQRRDNAFEDIQGKSSSQWLRRLNDREPAKKRKSSTGQKLHDEIMKSFLGHTESAHEVPETTLASAAGGVDITHVNKQIRLTIEQLIARLDDKKAVAYNVANSYRSGGKETLSVVRQRLLKDRDGLTVALSSQGELFHKKVQEVKDIVKTRSYARTESALELNEVFAARRRARGRVYQGLRAVRDECLGDTKAVAGFL